MRLKDNAMQLKIHIPYLTLIHLQHSIFQFVLDSLCVCTAMLQSCLMPKMVQYIQI
jgi:hypothetical protein